jgi:hypothetical protein
VGNALGARFSDRARLNQTELAIIIACSFDKAFEWAYRVADGVICVAQQVRCGTPHSKTALGFAVAPAR